MLILKTVTLILTSAFFYSSKYRTLFRHRVKKKLQYHNFGYVKKAFLYSRTKFDSVKSAYPHMADICSNVLYSTLANNLNLLRDAKIALLYIPIALVVSPGW